MGSVVIATQCLNQWVVSNITCLCQETRPAIIEEDIQRGTKMRELNEMRKQYIVEKGYTVVEMWESEWWKLYNTGVSLKEHFRESISYKRPFVGTNYWTKQNQADFLATDSLISKLQNI